MNKTLLIALVLMGLLSCAIFAAEEPEKVETEVEVDTNTEEEDDVEVEDDAEEESEEDTFNYQDYLRRTQAAEEYSVSARDVRTSALFPDHPSKEFPAGQPVELLAGFANNGMYPYNIHVFYTVLYNPDDSRYLVQNFTQRSSLNIPVKPNEETSLVFKFTPYKELEPRTYKLLSMLQYSDGSREYINVLYNDTVTITEPPPKLDLYEVTSFATMFAMIGGIFYGIYYLVAGGSKGKKAKRAPVAKKEGEVNEWLVGTKAHTKADKKKKRN